jgi:1,4-dihydroxy-2-naphthoate octaprenyltransferase
VNNIRDLETDRDAGKRTLAVMLGYRWSRVEFLALLGLSYAVPPVLWLGFSYPLAVLAPLLTLPLAVSLGQTVLTKTDGTALNPALERTGQLLALYSVLLAAGLVLPGVT